MSAQFIIRYAGQGVAVRNGMPDLVEDRFADKYISEADAWYAAYKTDLNPMHLTVVNLYLENQRVAGPQ